MVNTLAIGSCIFNMRPSPIYTKLLHIDILCRFRTQYLHLVPSTLYLFMFLCLWVLIILLFEQVMESKRLIKCFLNYLRHERTEVGALFDMLSIFLYRSRIDYSFLKEFYVIEVFSFLFLNSWESCMYLLTLSLSLIIFTCLFRLLKDTLQVWRKLSLTTFWTFFSQNNMDKII